MYTYIYRSFDYVCLYTDDLIMYACIYRSFDYVYGCGHGIGSNWDQRRCQTMSQDARSLALALISRDAAGTSRFPAAVVVCCTSRLISASAYHHSLSASTLLACSIRASVP